MTVQLSPHRTRLYRNGASQAVRIPKVLVFSEDIEVEIIRRRDEVMVRPARCPLTGIEAALKQFGTSMGVFEQDNGAHQGREWQTTDRQNP